MTASAQLKCWKMGVNCKRLSSTFKEYLYDVVWSSWLFLELAGGMIMLNYSSKLSERQQKHFAFASGGKLQWQQPTTSTIFSLGDFGCAIWVFHDFFVGLLN